MQRTVLTYMKTGNRVRSMPGSKTSEVTEGQREGGRNKGEKKWALR